MEERKVKYKFTPNNNGTTNLKATYEIAIINVTLPGDYNDIDDPRIYHLKLNLERRLKEMMEERNRK